MYLNKKVLLKFWAACWRKLFCTKLIPIKLFFFGFEETSPSRKSALCGPRWGSKTPAIPGSYKRCTPWLELKTCCANLKPFVITLRLLRTKTNKTLSIKIENFKLDIFKDFNKYYILVLFTYNFNSYLVYMIVFFPIFFATYIFI